MFPTQLQPDIDEPISIPLSPAQILDTIIRDHETAFWSRRSHFADLAKDDLLLELVAKNHATGNHARLIHAEDEEGDSSIYVVACELLVGGVYITGCWRVVPSTAEYRRATQQAEEAFIRAAGLIGKRVERQLVVIDPES